MLDSEVVKEREINFPPIEAELVRMQFAEREPVRDFLRGSAQGKNPHCCENDNENRERALQCLFHAMKSAASPRTMQTMP